MEAGGKLKTALGRCKRTAIDDVWYRSIDAELSARFFDSVNSVRPLWGLGPGVNGARFTPKGGAQALYVAEDLETANREALQVALGLAVKPAAGRAVTVYTVEVRLREVVDLRDVDVQSALGTTSVELASPWRFRKGRKAPPTHRLGRAAAKAGIEGLVFPSTKGAGVCLVIFLDNLGPGSRVKVQINGKMLEALSG